MRIGVIHLNQIGDLVFSLPLLKTLRESHPNARIISVIRPGIEKLLAGSPFVDRTVPRQGGVRETLKLVSSLRREPCDLLISLPRSEEAFILTAFSNASTKAGFARFPWDRVLDVKERVEGHNSWHNNARLLKRLGMEPAAGGYVGLLDHISPDESPVSLPEPYVVISAGASPRRLIKAWDEDRFAELITLLHGRYGLRPVLVGAGDTAESNEKITRAVRNDPAGRSIDVLDLTGKLGLRALVAFLKKASLFVGIDSGVMHLASAVDIPVVGLFGPTDPFYVGPQNGRSLVVREEMECLPCYLNKTCSDAPCMRKLEAGKVFEACARLLGTDALQTTSPEDAST